MSGGSKKQTIGYHYRWAMHFGWCTSVDAFLEFRAGGVTAWAGRLTESDEIEINKPDLWGGEKGEGGISGGKTLLSGSTLAAAKMDILFGEATQEPNDYLRFVFGDQQSAHRGKLTTVFKGGRFGAFIPNPKPVSVKVERILKDWKDDTPWYQTKARIVVAPDTLLSADLAMPGTDAGTSPGSGILFAGLSAEDIVIVHKIPGLTYAAWSVWESDSNPLADGLPWSNSFRVTDDQDQTTSYWPERYATAAEAEAAAIASPIFLTGSSSYTIWLFDSPVEDNRGGFSVRAFRGGIVAMNPAHMIYDAITHPDMLGEPAGLINEESFIAAADRLYSESFGLCTTYDADQETPEQFIQRVCNIIGAACTQSRTDGLYYLDLIRGDQDIDSLPIIDEDDVIEFEQDPSVIAETTNVMRVEWFDPASKQERTTSPVYALGNIRSSGGQAPETRVYHEIPTELLALRVAKRELRAVATPLSRFRLTVRRKHRGLRPGKAFRLQMPSEGIADMVCIVGDIAHGTHKDGRVRIVAVQDVYTMPDTVHVQPEPGLWQPPDRTPAPSPNQAAIESPYIELAATLSSADLSGLPDDVGYMLTIATQPSSGINYVIHSAAAGEELEERGDADWCPTAVIVEAAGYLDSNFTFSSAQGLENVAIGSWALWDDEIVRVDAIDAELATIELGRGCADTPPLKHAAGKRIYFAGDWVGSDQREYVDGETVTAKLLTRTLSSQQSATGATELEVTMDQRAARPYAPGDLRINDQSYPTEVEYTFTLSWAHRDRLLQADQLIDATLGGVGPEEGVTYTVRGYLDDELKFTVTDIEDTSLSDLSFEDNGHARIEVEAVRDGLTSFRATTAEFDYIGAVTLTDDIPDWSVGNAFAHTPHRAGGAAPFVWSVESGALPVGLSLDANTGEISGTPTTDETAAYTLRVTDANDGVDEIAVSQRIYADASFANVLLLVDATGKADGTSFTDESPAGRALTAAGNARILDEHIELDGDGDWITAPDHSDWRFFDAANLDFTMELFGVVFDAVGGTGNGDAQELISQYDAFAPALDQRAWRLGQAGGNLGLNLSSGGSAGTITSESVAWVPTLGQSYDIAFVRSGTSYYLFVDGVQVHTFSSGVVLFDASSPLAIGGRNTRAADAAVSDDFDGRIRAVRVTRGARYTGDYTVPILPLPKG